MKKFFKGFLYFFDNSPKLYKKNKGVWGRSEAVWQIYGYESWLKHIHIPMNGA